jgi:hypothetical protein
MDNSMRRKRILLKINCFPLPSLRIEQKLFAKIGAKDELYIVDEIDCNRTIPASSFKVFSFLSVFK